MFLCPDLPVSAFRLRGRVGGWLTQKFDRLQNKTLEIWMESGMNDWGPGAFNDPAADLYILDGNGEDQEEHTALV